ncbi:aldehyde dehydrogenase family protein [Rhodoligotrophos defluvii]|uniref:aldehyde dehydrogenase family protein n=1 Tax=Rhodoligotrophos defluvii TaxID=2561934 RepID=UPI0019617E49|nr:aldehyde dehydrogenase family protein [Rhodoligotrophos defluvii]
MTAIVEEILAGDKRASGAADLMLQTAEWAAAAFARFDRSRVDSIARAAADVAYAHAGELAEAAVRETGFGVVEHKTLKNELTSRGLYELYAKHDFCSPRILADQKMVELPRPAGIVFALTPSTNPVCTVYYKVLMALVTRNAIVVSPHPMAKACSTRAAKLMAEAAEAAGAPAGIIQVIDQPSLPLIEHIMKSPRIGVILATGGTPMVRAAYSSGNPAIGVGPGNAPALVDDTADPAEAAKRIVASKSFDNSILCTNESVVIAVEQIADRLLQGMKSAGAHVAKPEEVAALRELLFGRGSFNVGVLGKSAVEIGAMIGLRLPGNTKIILAEIDRVGMDEPLSKEKLCPVLGFLSVPHAQAGIAQARSLIRLSGAGHSAAIHSRNSATILAYGAAVKALRVVVNAPCSQGAAGYGTHLAPAFTIGTGYFGSSSIGENVGPQHLINWTRIAYSDDPREAFGDFTQLDAWAGGPALALGREAPISLGRLQEGSEQVRNAVSRDAVPAQPSGAGAMNDISILREEIRRMVLEELRDALRS